MTTGMVVEDWEGHPRTTITAAEASTIVTSADQGGRGCGRSRCTRSWPHNHCRKATHQLWFSPLPSINWCRRQYLLLSLPMCPHLINGLLHLADLTPPCPKMSMGPAKSSSTMPMRSAWSSVTLVVEQIGGVLYLSPSSGSSILVHRKIWYEEGWFKDVWVFEMYVMAQFKFYKILSSTMFQLL